MQFVFENTYKDEDQAAYAVIYFQRQGFVAAQMGTAVRCWV